MSKFYEFEMNSITGEPVKFEQFQNKVCLVVNVASFWGATPQYAGLRTLFEENDDLVVMGFPCNQFGAQEPKSNAEILEFVKSKYDVTFPMFEKIEVKGDGAAPLYQFLCESQPQDDGSQDIKWNFEKFLVDRQGVVQKRYGTQVTPEEIAKDLGDYL